MHALSCLRFSKLKKNFIGRSPSSSQDVLLRIFIPSSLHVSISSIFLFVLSMADGSGWFWHWRVFKLFINSPKSRSLLRLFRTACVIVIALLLHFAWSHHSCNDAKSAFLPCQNLWKARISLWKLWSLITCWLIFQTPFCRLEPSDSVTMSSVTE